MLKPNLGDRLELQIDSLSFPSGFGVGRSQQFVFFVPFSCPQDLLSVEVTKVKKNYAEAKILEILTPSPQRSEPPCPYYFNCGGCSLQHMQYDAQVFEKKKVLTSTLSKFLHRKIILNSFNPSEEPLRYRTRLQVYIKNQQVGFFQNRSKNHVPIKDCLLAKEKLTQAFPQLEDKRYNNKKIDLFIDEKEKVNFILNDHNLNTAHFQQANQSLNHRLKETIVNKIEHFTSEIETIYDLYCGSGNYSIELAKKFPNISVIGVDISKRLISKAQTQTKDLKNIQFIAKNISDFLTKENLKQNSMIVVNPPRTGLEKIVSLSLKKSSLKKLLYVSCNPSTLARDLIDLEDFSLTEIHGFDMFPQTMHMETVSFLCR
ncbi:MAG: class I SAM-dependent RNA methyltransferase [Bdellovibrionales bacterium]|nr:class I SAM-dependent RNA methyltransferase [Bdellovibrionales bacterium]